MPTGLRRIAPIAASAIVSVLVMLVLATGAGPVPALGQALSLTGVWASAAGGQTPHSQSLDIPGLSRPATVSFTRSGVASIVASNDHDLFLAQGYVAAWFRLTQMDLERRLGEGRLAQLQGAAAVGSDEFELRLGLERTAAAEWAATPRSSPAGQALLAYAEGVNHRLAELGRDHQWPAIYALTGIRPAAWTPVDSLVVQEVLTQQLDFTTAPLDYSILDRSLGRARTAEWFPVEPANAQHPYDPGPYHYDGIAPLAAPDANAAPYAPAGHPAGAARTGMAPTTTAVGSTALAVTAAAAVLGQVTRLPGDVRHVHPDSNAWSVNGARAGGSASLLAGDPHLPLSLPSYWYAVSLRSPQFDVAGASLPGVPAIVLGHNQHIAWSLTNVQNQSTLFYVEKTSPSHPGEYFWRGAWRSVRRVHYSIPVRAGGTVRFTADLTVHGPIMTEHGQTTSVDWMGDIPSPDLAALLAINTTADWSGFTNALRGWRAPTQNFAFADDRGNIGIIAAGYYPLVRSGEPWLPLPGTGQSDVAGTIPFAAVPRVYDPPGHLAITANQRPVTAAYPYYIGTSQGFDPGYRAGEIYAALGRSHAGLAGSAALQNSYTDELAGEIVPRLLAALRGTSPGPVARAAQAQLAGWNNSMDMSSPAATIWWKFWNEYLQAVFQPWWRAAHVPTRLDTWNLSTGSDPPPLVEDLEQWTLHDPGNPAFTPPGGHGGSSLASMRTAFSTAIAQLTRQLGHDPRTWSWGRLHQRKIPSLLGDAALGYGPHPSSGDPWTVNAADDGLTSDFGPSWRMITDWSGRGRATSQAVYPGGQSENPASSWYENFVPSWWNGRYFPLGMAAEKPAAAIVWTLRPER